jgi:hypothetical protein
MVSRDQKLLEGGPEICLYVFKKGQKGESCRQQTVRMRARKKERKKVVE